MASIRWPILRSFLLVCLFFFVACGDSGPSGPDPLDSIASVTVSPDQATVDVGSTTQLDATVLNGRGETMTTSVTWSSSVETVATTNGSGLVTGVAEGTTTITASAGGKSDTSVITVNDPFPPDQPSNVVATPVSNTQVQVTWTDNSNNEDDFRVDREAVVGPVSGTDEEPARVYTEVGTVGPDVTTFSDTGLESGAAYNYQVRACNENGCSDPTAIDDAVSTFDELMIETAILPGGTVGVAYEQTLTASGGDGTYLWTVSAGALPDGLSLNSGSGVVAGMPAVEGDFPFTIQVQSGGGQAATVNLSVEVVFIFSCSTQTEIPTAECEALETLYNTTNGPGWTNSTNWLADLTPCDWHGVTCAGGSVTELNLYGNGLDGPIPSELADLPNLTWLHLRRNDLTGAIPSELGGLADLERLDLAFNQLSGSIPPQLGALSSLDQLTLQVNELTGTIPPELWSLTNLTTLALGSNPLTGEISSEIGNLQGLIWLNLNFTQMSGPIPPEFGTLGNLYEAYMDSNKFSGAIPAEVGQMGSLGRLFLGGNELSGAIPPEFGNVTSLERLDLGENNLTGPIPSELGNLTNLTNLGLRKNQLTGTIPPELGSLTNLEVLELFGNQLSGAIPPEIGNLASLRILFLKYNQLSGAIPPEVGNLTNLTSAYLQYNEFTGALPSELGNLANLLFLDLHSNQVSGEIPPEMGNMESLVQLTLTSNQLTGAIPAELGNLTKLVQVRLSSNQLTGTVPLSVAQLGGIIQNAHGASRCDFLPGNVGLSLLDTQAYRDADLDGDGFICELPFPPGPAPGLNLVPGSSFSSFNPPASYDPFAPRPWPGVGRDRPHHPH